MEESAYSAVLRAQLDRDARLQPLTKAKKKKKHVCVVCVCVCVCVLCELSGKERDMSQLGENGKPTRSLPRLVGRCRHREPSARAHRRGLETKLFGV